MTQNRKAIVALLLTWAEHAEAQGKTARALASCLDLEFADQDPAPGDRAVSTRDQGAARARPHQDPAPGGDNLPAPPRFFGRRSTSSVPYSRPTAPRWASKTTSGRPALTDLNLLGSLTGPTRPGDLSSVFAVRKEHARKVVEALLDAGDLRSTGATQSRRLHLTDQGRARLARYLATPAPLRPGYPAPSSKTLEKHDQTVEAIRAKHLEAPPVAAPAPRQTPSAPPPDAQPSASVARCIGPTMDPRTAPCPTGATVDTQRTNRCDACVAEWRRRRARPDHDYETVWDGTKGSLTGDRPGASSLTRNH